MYLKLKPSVVYIGAFIKDSLPLAFCPRDFSVGVGLTDRSCNAVVFEAYRGVDLIVPPHHLHLWVEGCCVF